MKRKAAIAAIATGLLLLLMLWGALALPKNMAGVEVSVPPGASSGRIAALLEENGVIRSGLLFKIWVRISGQAEKLQSGLYHFEGDYSLLDAAAKLRRGDVLLFKVTVPEGLRTDEILHKLAVDTGVGYDVWYGHLTRLIGGVEIEGFLLPETYTYSKPIEPEKLVKQMLDAQKKVLDELAQSSDERMRLRVLASIIEKETRLDNERELVSAVIRNRLQQGKPLQMDPTVIYGIWRRDGGFSGNLHKKDLLTDTPWNSYTRRGIPPTPICNPGAASLRAAKHPADVDYLYFVADGSGGHAFASTLAEHNANVARWIDIERGK